MTENEIDYKVLYEQVIAENEGLREKLTSALLKDNPLSDAIDSTIDGIVLVVQRSDPMKLYIWVCIAFMLIMACARLLEVFIK